jgi:hypothetical protein
MERFLGKEAGVNAEQARELRTSRAAELRRQTRSARSMAKRRRNAESGAAVDQREGSATLAAVRLGVERAVVELSAYHATGGAGLGVGAGAGAAAAVRALRQWLALPAGPGSPGGSPLEEQVGQLCAERGLAGLLAPLLRPRSGDALELELAVDAAWCVTNLASGSELVTSSTLCCVPGLVVVLRESEHAALVEQAAWALGNMAGDSPEARVRLRELGVLAPLVALLRAAPAPTQQEVRVEPSAGLRRTAAWALCNMMRGGETPARPFVDAGADAALLAVLAQVPMSALPRVGRGVAADAPDTPSRHLLDESQAPERGLLIETFWCLAFFTAKEPELCAWLYQQGALELLVPVVERLVGGLEPFSRFHASQLDVQLILPALRAVANIMPVLHPDAIRQALTAHPMFAPALARLLQSDIHAEHVALCKEALWAVGNCVTWAGGDEAAYRTSGSGNASPVGPTSLQPERDPTFLRMLEIFLQPLALHFCCSQFELQREAAFAILALALRPSPDTLIKALQLKPQVPGQRPVLEVMLHLLRTPQDMDLCRAALDFTEQVLAKLSNPFAAARLGGRSGSQLVQLYDGIDALEALQYAGGPLAERAQRLVDRFFGEDYEERDDDEGLLDEDHRGDAVAFRGLGGIDDAGGGGDDDDDDVMPRGTVQFFAPSRQQLQQQGPGEPGDDAVHKPATTATAFTFGLQTQPQPQPQTPPPSAMGRGRDMLRPAWMTAPERKPGTPTPLSQSTLPEYFGNNLMKD